MAQASVVYGFAALSKLNGDYLSGRALAPFVPVEASASIIGMRATAVLILLAAWIAIPLEALLAVWLWLPSRRVAAARLGIAMHLGMVAAMYRMRVDLTVFALEMWALYLLFLGPAAVAVVQRALRNRPVPAGQRAAGEQR